LRLVRDYALLGKTQQQRQVGYDLFLSHYKIQAGSECQLLKSTVEAVKSTMRVFLDSDNLQRLNELPHLVKMSKMFVLIMSPHPLNQSNTLERFGPFGRMYCIVELITWYQQRESMPAVVLEMIKNGFQKGKFPLTVEDIQSILSVKDWEKVSQVVGNEHPQSLLLKASQILSNQTKHLEWNPATTDKKQLVLILQSFEMKDIELKALENTIGSRVFFFPNFF